MDSSVVFVFINSCIESSNISLDMVDKLVRARYPDIRKLDHIEAYNLFQALRFVESISNRDITVGDIQQMHYMLLQRIDNASRGRFRTIDQCDVDGFVASSSAIDHDMRSFCAYINSSGFCEMKKYEQMAAVHVMFVNIAPFFTRNYVIARLLVAYVQLRAGLSHQAVLFEDVEAYKDALSISDQLKQKSALEGIFKNVCGDCDKVSDEQVAQEVAAEDISANTAHKTSVGKIKVRSIYNPFVKKNTSKFIKISQLSNLSGESVSTIRYWISIGLLSPVEYTKSGHGLFDASSLDRIAEIVRYKEKGLMLEEIRAKV